MQHADLYRFSNFVRNRTLGTHTVVTLPMLHFPRENQFRHKRTVLIIETFHFTCSDFLAESKIEKRMRHAHFFLHCHSIVHFLPKSIFEKRVRDVKMQHAY